MGRESLGGGRILEQRQFFGFEIRKRRWAKDKHLCYSAN